MSGHEKNLRTEIKQTIARLKNKGHSGRKIGKLLDIEPSTINKFLKRYNERGDVENKHWSGTPRKCNNQTDRHLIRVVKINCRKTLQDITATLNEGTPVKISHSTVRRRLSFFGYKRRIVKKKIIVSNVNRFKRRAMVQVKATLYG
jgi:putative transposase